MDWKWTKGPNGLNWTIVDQIDESGPNQTELAELVRNATNYSMLVSLKN